MQDLWSEFVNAVSRVWNFLIGFPPDVASAALGVILTVIVAGAIAVVIRKGNVRLSFVTFCWPLVIYTLSLVFAWLVSWVPDPTFMQWLSGGFSLTALVSFVWALINTIRLIFNK